MTLEEKYIRKIVPRLSGRGEVKTKEMNGKTAYMFPCPFCSHLATSKGKVRDAKRTAILMPRQDCEYVYTFKCARNYSPECRGGARGFLNFLIMFDPYLAEKYKFEKLHT